MKTDDIMRLLGYTREWLELGVVTEESLHAQHAEFVSSNDKNKEHYRHGAFMEWLRDRTALSDTQIGAVVALHDEGTDGVDLRRNRFVELLICRKLSDEQFNDLAKFPQVREAPCEKLFRRHSILRQINTSGITDPLFEEVCESQDSELQRTLLSRSDLGRTHVAWFAEYGRSKAIRNIAAQMLNNKRVRERDR